MNAKRYFAMVLCSLALLPIAGRLDADQAPCVIISSGAETDAGTGSVQNVGQTVIGRASNASIQMRAGGIPCLVLATTVTCTLGDLDDNGLINGPDISPYVRVRITGTGTPQELCAANITIPGFVILLLGP